MEYNKDDNKPILVQFENGPLKDELKSSVDFQYLRSTMAKSKKRMLVANCGNLMYTGNVLQKQSSLVKYYVGIVDKKTCRIKNVTAVQLCTLKPKLIELAKEKKEPLLDKSYRQKTDTLVESFGSAKQKRLVSSRKKNDSVHESIGEKVAGIAKKILQESPKTPSGNESVDDDSHIIPPMDMNAKTASEMYHIDDIISFQDYQFLKEHAREMTYADEKTLLLWKNETKYSEFILHHLSQLPSSSTERQEKGCYICYLNYLIAFSKVTYKDIRKRDPCPDIPEQLQTNILDKFSHSENGRNRCVPKKYKDKIICYIFVLALILEDYNMNCNLLIKELKLGVSRVTKLLRAIGCTVSTSNLKRKEGEGTLPSERVIRANLTTSHVQIKSVNACSTTPSSPRVKDVNACSTIPSSPRVKDVNACSTIPSSPRVKSESSPIVKEERET